MYDKRRLLYPLIPKLNIVTKYDIFFISIISILVLFIKMFYVKQKFYIMSTKTKQQKMVDYVTAKKDDSKKRVREKDGNDSESKKSKSGQVDLSTINFDCDKKSTQDKMWNMKIVSWNVAGIRAWLKVGKL